MSPTSFLCIGHRGAMGHAPENTLLSIQTAIEMGCSWIEIDVHYVDRQLLVIHDFRLERTTNGAGLVANHTFDYLRSLDAGDGQRIPTLHEVFELVDHRAGINVELKGKHTAIPVAEFLQAMLQSGWQPESLLVSSFDHRELTKFKELAPLIPLGALVYGVPEDNAAIAERLGATSVIPSLQYVDEEFVQDAQQRGLRVYVYTVNEPEDIVRMRQLGVDGVFTNFPERVFRSGQFQTCRTHRSSE